MQLREELQAREDLMRHRSMSKRTRQGHSRTKQRTGGGTQREAKLNPKAHRRTNRREVLPRSKLSRLCITSDLCSQCTAQHLLHSSDRGSLALNLWHSAAGQQHASDSHVP